MNDDALTERQKREREYYEEYARRAAPAEVCYDPVAGRERRPWNSYWFVIEQAKHYFKAPGQRLLDFGCGAGEFSFLYANIGYEVFAFDISPQNIAIARGRAAKDDPAGRTHFSVGLAERLDYEAESFDVIVGVDILHHVEIGRAIAECARVLKKGGVAIFHEPVRVPVFDRLRETNIGLRLSPKSVSYDRHITQDERKLTPADLETICRLAPEPLMRRFLLTSRLGSLIGVSDASRVINLEKADYYLLKLLPWLRRFGGRAVLTLRKER
jgi:ubiquinone/menaquinone biosynthesis C-methylase UbiE